MISSKSFPYRDSSIFPDDPVYIELLSSSTITNLYVYINNVALVSADTVIGSGYIKDLPDGNGRSIFLYNLNQDLGLKTLRITYSGKEESFTFTVSNRSFEDLITNIYLDEDKYLFIDTENDTYKLNLKKDYMLIDYLNRRIYFPEDYDEVEIAP
jgi:hypothetical protein